MMNIIKKVFMLVIILLIKSTLHQDIALVIQLFQLITSMLKLIIKFITVKAAVKNKGFKYNCKLILKSIFIIHKFSKTLLIKGNNTITMFCVNIYIIFY